MPVTTDGTKRLSHKDDPWTSRAAAREMVRSGRLEEDARFALAMVKKMPDATAIELGQEAHYLMGTFSDEAWRQKIGRRLPELERTCKCGHDHEAHQPAPFIGRCRACGDADKYGHEFVGLIKRSGTKKVGKRHATTWRANE